MKQLFHTSTLFGENLGAIVLFKKSKKSTSNNSRSKQLLKCLVLSISFLILFTFQSTSTYAQCSFQRVLPSNQTAPASGGVLSYDAIVSPYECDASFSGVPSWASIYYDISSGGITVNVTANSGSSRNAYISATINNTTRGFYVSQSAGVSYYINPSTSSLSFGASGGNQTFTISTNTTNPTVSSSGVGFSASISGSTITVNCTSNTSTSSRSGSVTVTGNGVNSTVSLSQAGATPYISLPSSVSFSASASTISVGILGTNVTSGLSVSYSGCVSTASVSGTSYISVTCSQNTSTSPRSGSVTVTGGGASASISVTQAGAVVYYITPSPGLLNYSASGGNQSVSISTNVTSGLSVSYSGCVSNAYISGSTVTVICSSNTSCSDRTGSVTITGGGTSSSVQVNQSAVPPASTPTISALGLTTFCSGGSVTLRSSSASSNRWSDGSTSQDKIVTSSGTYSVQVANSSGCYSSSSNSIVVTVNPLPNISISGNTSICYGDCTTLTASGANSYVWSNGQTGSSINICPTTNTTYYVTGTSNGCSNTASKTVYVTPLPSISISGNTTIRYGSCTRLTASGASSYSWSNGSKVSYIDVCPSSNTTYSVTGTTNGCSSNSSVTVTVIPDELSINCSNVNFDYNTGPQSCYITSNISWTTSVTSGNTWLSVSPFSGTGGSAITMSCTTNTGALLRTGTIEIHGTGTSITRTINVVQMGYVPVPNTPIVSNQCGQSVLSFNGTPPSGVTWYWQTSDQGTDTSNSASPRTVTSAGTYYLRAKSSDGSWSSSSISVSASPSAIPTTATVGTTQNLCGTLVSGSLGGNTPTVGTGAWSQVSGPGTSTFSAQTSGSSTATATTYGTYIYQWIISNGSCTPSSAQVTVSFNQRSADPTSATTNLNPICYGESTVLTLNGGGGGTSETIKWYTGSCGSTTPAGIGNNLSVSPAVTTTYYGRYEDGTPCNYNSNCASVTVVVNQKSADPTSATTSLNPICNGESTVLTLNGGGGGTSETIKWYTGLCGSTTPAGIGNNLSVSPAVTTTYYGRYEDGTPCNYNSNCASVTVIVNPTSVGGSVSEGTTICSGSTSGLLTLSGHTGTVTKWQYSVSPFSTWTDISNTSTSYAPGALTQTTKFRAVVTSGVCSPATSGAATVTVNSLSTAPTSITTTLNHVCPQEPVTLSVNGGSLGTEASWKWYDNSDLTTIVGTGNTLNTSRPETTTYYVRAEGACNTTATTSLIILVDTVNPGKIFFADTISYTPIVNKTITSQTDAVAGHCGFAYSWQKALAPKVKTDPLAWVDVANQTSKTLLIDRLDASTYFKRGAKDLTNHLAYTDSILIQIIDTLIVPPSALLVDGASLTVHKGRYGKYGEWAWYSNFKGQPVLTTDSVSNSSPSRSTRYRVRAEWKDTINGTPVDKHSYFVSNKIRSSETINLPSDQNYILSYSPVKETTSESDISNLPLEEQGAVVQYFDGLGRPTQTVAANQSYYFNDVVTGVRYDSFGRQDSTYLSATNHGKGDFVANQPSLIRSFYSGPHNEIDGLPGLTDNSKTASRTVYEPSPLNRVTSTIDAAGGTTSYLYGTNDASDVILWTVSDDVANNIFGTLSTAKSYDTNELYMTQTTDPDGKTTKEYKDKLGQVVLKQAYDGQTAHSTYYVYDDFGLLRYVISPQAVIAMTGNSYSPTSDVVKGLCYYYEYDGRKRMVKKQLPGADPVLMVYDTRDRLILTQDGKTRAENGQKWMYTKYDEINRPIENGWMTTSDPWGTLQTTFANIVGYSTYTNETALTKTHYDNYSGYPGTLPATYNSAIKGLVTWKESTWLSETGNVITAYFYDDKYRVIQSKITGSPIEQVTTNTYDFVGKLLTSTETYSGQVTQTINKWFTYDHAGRLEKAEQQITGDNVNKKVVLAQNDYNELGQLMLKKLHMANDTSYVQDIDYLYDIRGWLKSINNMTDTTFRKLYAEDLEYNPNGNISSMNWKNTMLRADGWVNPSNKQAYDFIYDGLNRILTASYSETNPSGAAVAVKAGFFDENPTYDLNGNMATLARQGNTLISGFTKGLIDNLAYTYLPNSNQIASITDTGVGAAHNKEFKPTAASFAYDLNGNATTVPHKGSTITYNYLNLPETVTIAGEGSISYLYDAAGNKLKKAFGSVNSFYQGSVLKIADKTIVLTGEGRSVNNGTWAYEYDLKDHLGNTRVSFGVDTTRAVPLQYKEYYPFGMEMMNNIASNADATKYLYNGKELQDEGGLDMYDYGARFYDPTIGRWHSPDLLAEKYYDWSPYNYVGSNPIKRVDLLGLDWYTDTDGTYQYDPKVNKDTELQKDQKYVGETYEIKDKNGNVTTNYRKDGSIFYTKDKDAIKRLSDNDKKYNREELGFFTDGGVLVTPNYKNKSNDSEPTEKYGYKLGNNVISDASGNSFNVLGTIHTHFGADPWPSGVSDGSLGDLQTFSRYTPNRPALTLSEGGTIYGIIGKYQGGENKWGWLPKMSLKDFKNDQDLRQKISKYFIK